MALRRRVHRSQLRGQLRVRVRNTLTAFPFNPPEGEPSPSAYWPHGIGVNCEPFTDDGSSFACCGIDTQVTYPQRSNTARCSPTRRDDRPAGPACTGPLPARVGVVPLLTIRRAELEVAMTRPAAPRSRTFIKAYFGIIPSPVSAHVAADAPRYEPHPVASPQADARLCAPGIGALQRRSRRSTARRLSLPARAVLALRKEPAARRIEPHRVPQTRRRENSR